MKKSFFYFCIFVLIYCLPNIGINAQNIDLYGLYTGIPDSVTGYSSVKFVKIEPLTANMTIIDTLSMVDGILSGASTFDNSCHHYVFIGHQTAGNTVMVLDTTGAILSQYPEDPHLSSLQFDLQNGLFYGLCSYNTQVLKLVTYNPQNGAVNAIQSLNIVSGVNSGSETFNSNSTKYMFIGYDTLNVMKLFTIDIPSGTITGVNINSGDNLCVLHYDNVTDKLFGLYRNLNANPVYFCFAEIDTLTANVTVMDTLYQIEGIYATSSAYDQASSSFIIQAVNKLYVIDAITGQVISDQPISLYAGEIECDNSRFAKNFYTTSGVGNHNPLKDDIVIFPNPSMGYFRVCFENVIPQDVTITVTNNLNQVVYEKEYPGVSGRFSGSINLNNVADGMFYVHVKNGNNVKIKALPVIK